jgi:hypothetical protein
MKDGADGRLEVRPQVVDVFDTDAGAVRPYSTPPSAYPNPETRRSVRFKRRNRAEVL